MPRSAARLRISIKDNATREGIKVELIEAPGLSGEGRYHVRRATARRQAAALQSKFHRTLASLKLPSKFRELGAQLGDLCAEGGRLGLEFR